MAADDVAVLLRGCDTEGVCIARAPGRGRLLQATKSLDAEDLVFSAPLERQIRVPDVDAWSSCGDSHATDLDADAPDARAQIQTYFADGTLPSQAVWNCLLQDYATVVDVCLTEGDEARAAESYWAALHSLRDCETSPTRCWPTVTDDVRERMLLMFQPPYLAFAHRRPAEGTEVDLLQLDKRLDRVALRLCEIFGCSVSGLTLSQLMMVWRYNGFHAGSTGVLDLYVVPALMNHSCDPNCHWVRADGRFELLAVKGIAAGEELTAAYLDDDYLAESTLLRRALIARGWLFFCTCDKCAFITPPTCTSCTGKSGPMTVVVGPTEAPIYPGADAYCHACNLQDLQQNGVYFFHCTACAVDFCPTCAVKKVPTALTSPCSSSFNGSWTHIIAPDKSDGLETILGDVIVWGKGSYSRFAALTEDTCCISYEGCQHKGRLDGERIQWDDGDIWVRAY